MQKYKILVFIYLVSVLSPSLASLTGIDVQVLYRVPYLNTRWIDIAILLIVISNLFNLLFNYKKVLHGNLVIILCFLYLGFEVIGLLKSWKNVETEAQISHFICTLSLFIVIDLSRYKIPTEQIVRFLRSIAIWGSVALLISNSYLFYSFISG